MNPQRMCKSKIVFRSKADALVYASRSLRRRNCDTFHFRAYLCPLCQRFHLTKQPESPAKP